MVFGVRNTDAEFFTYIFTMNTKTYLQQGKLIFPKIKKLARKYRVVTGRPLGITGEVAEYEAIRLLKLTVCEARTPGYDATRKRNGKIEKIQIKGRSLQNDSKRGQRIGSIRLDKKWDTVVLVILNDQFNPIEIFEAARKKIQEALRETNSKARKRGQLSISKFKGISKKVWPR